MLDLLIYVLENIINLIIYSYICFLQNILTIITYLLYIYIYIYIYIYQTVAILGGLHIQVILSI